ncbi:ABC transporter substrate-binding protein [Sphingomonas bacterium]|uniref:ABC transporter substrate-binding protein n=1 Tax=Sphingomonas bacterium TaxID=1895847 RepID=UPI0034A0A15E
MTDDPILSRRLMLLGATASAALALAGCGKRPAGQDAVLRASVTGHGETDARLIFKSAGIKPAGFSVTYAEFQSGQMVIEALNGGSLDLGGMSEIPPVFALASAIQSFKQIAVFHGDVNNQVVLVPRGSRIETLAQLKGKRVGYVRATTSQYYLIRMLQSVGLDWSDIEPVALNVSDGASAFSNGALDAWAIYGFPIQRAVATEGARILKTALGFLSGNYIVSAHVDALADAARAKIIGDYLRLLKRGFGWTASHQGEWAGIVARDIGVPPAYVADQFKRQSDVFSLRPVTAEAIASQQGVADLFAERKLIPHKVDVRTLWDDRYNAIIEEKA